MWLPLAILISIVIWFYLGAIYLTVVAWLNAIGHLLRGNFTRAAAWFSIGSGMIFWWMSADIDFDAWLHGSGAIVALGALGTFARFYNRHRRAAQADAQLEAAPPVTFMNINIEPDSSQHAVEPTPRLHGAKQRPRRLPGPTVNPPALRS
jgi:hypothetical protein